MDEPFEFRSEVLKTDADLGLVFGWGIICTEDGAEYFDTQGDCIPEDAMLAATTDFMKNARLNGVMHARTGDGDVVKAGTTVHSMPLTADIAKVFGIETKKTGWMLAVAPEPNMLAKFKDGTFTGFSIGGKRIVDDVVEA